MFMPCFFVSLFFVAVALQPRGPSQTVLVCHFKQDHDFYFSCTVFIHHGLVATHFARVMHAGAVSEGGGF